MPDKKLLGDLRKLVTKLEEVVAAEAKKQFPLLVSPLEAVGGKVKTEQGPLIVDYVFEVDGGLVAILVGFLIEQDGKMRKTWASVRADRPLEVVDD